MACTCTGFEIFDAVSLDGLAKTPNSLSALPVTDTTVVHLQEPILGVAGSGKATTLEIRNYVVNSLNALTSRTYKVDSNSSYLNYRIQSIPTSGSYKFTFRIPSDFLSISELYMVGAPTSAGAAGPGKNITLSSSYGNINESTSIHTQIQPVVVDTGTLDVFFKLDLLPAFNAPGVSANDICGIDISHNVVGGAIGYFCIGLIYNRIV